jgi:NADH oxidase (H2O2-forming)
MRVVIIGGGVAGSNLALELRKLSKEVEIIVLEKSNYLYSKCALPYVIAREINFKDIFLTRKETYQENNIEFKNNCEVFDINKNKKEILFLENGEKKKLKYDKLVIAVGSKAFIPKIKGLDHVNYFTFKNLEDAKKLDKEAKKSKKIVIVGGGAIGVELAYALNKRGSKVTIVEVKDRVVPASLDSDMASILENYLERKGIEIIKNSTIKEVKNKKLIVGNKKIKFDLLIITTGFRANIELAKKAKIKYNRGILVNEYMQTSDKNIYACGDCVETKHFLTNKNIVSQFATTGLRQIKVIAKNLLGKKIKFITVLNNHISKIGELYYGSTGANKELAEKFGFKIITAKYTTKTKPDYYKKGKEITVKLICNLDGKILGAQIVGYENFADKLNLITLGIKKGLKLDDLINAETCYNPCVSNPINELAIVAEMCKKKLELI